MTGMPRRARGSAGAERGPAGAELCVSASATMRACSISSWARWIRARRRDNAGSVLVGGGEYPNQRTGLGKELAMPLGRHDVIYGRGEPFFADLKERHPDA